MPACTHRITDRAQLNMVYRHRQTEVLNKRTARRLNEMDRRMVVEGMKRNKK